MSQHLTDMPDPYFPDHDLLSRSRNSPRPRASVADRQRMCAVGARLFAAIGPAVGMTQIRTEAKVHNTSHGAHPTKQDLLADLLTEHLAALGAAVARAEEVAAGLAPEALLERLILAWMDGVAAAPDAHRAFLLCAHILPPDTQRALDLYRRIAIEQIQSALTAAVPALADHPEASLALYPLIRLLLSDPYSWPAPPESAERQSAARRLAGMLIAAAEAETLGHWPRLGLTQGPERGRPPLAVSYNQARVRLREILDGAEAGRDTIITRRGRVIARVVQAEGQAPPKPKRTRTRRAG
jgi:AcrR family transcriptional regulator